MAQITVELSDGEYNFLKFLSTPDKNGHWERVEVRSDDPKIDILHNLVRKGLVNAHVIEMKAEIAYYSVMINFAGDWIANGKLISGANLPNK